MADLNQAWHVLSDPVRRHDYDRALRAAAAPTASTGSAVPPSTRSGDEVDEATLAAMRGPRRDPLRSYHDRPRFPWKLVVVIVVVGAAAILFFGSFTKPAPERMNNIIGAGSCVTIDVRRGEVAQASCKGAHDAVVQELVEFGAPCPQGTESYRDRQGLGDACVVRITQPTPTT
jgi:hypothetical protein